MKGFSKAIARTPFTVTSKIGMAKKSSDPELDEYNRNFIALEGAAEKFLKDTKSFIEAVNNLFTTGAGFSTHFAAIFTPFASEYDLIGKHPDAAHTVRNVTKFEATMDELRQAISPELELIESRIVGPIKEFQAVMKLIRKTITKRDHKLTDYDRFNNSLAKLRDKKEKSLSDEKNLFKLEQDYEVATSEYEFINNTLKEDLPRFMQQAAQFIDPLFHSFYYMQLNIFYLLLEKLNGFAQEAKYDVTGLTGGQIQGDYEAKRTNAWQQIEEMQITKRIISTSRMVQANRAGKPPPSPSSSTLTVNGRGAPPSRSPTLSPHSGFKKGPPPPPPGSASPHSLSAPPPPYSASTKPSLSPVGSPMVRSVSGSSTSTAAAAKRPPPPPPPLKPKPKPKPLIKYVIAQYDFVAQADGDLSFNVGDQIELVERTQSSEDWWTGRLNGVQGIFPGNYVQDA